MKEIYIEIKPFFEMLKAKEQSMWSVFAQLVKDEPQRIVFINEDKKVDFEYILPNNLAQLKQDQQEFSEAFKMKLNKF